MPLSRPKFFTTVGFALTGLAPLALFIVALGSTSWTDFSYQVTSNDDNSDFATFQYGVFRLLLGNGTSYIWQEKAFCGGLAPYPSAQLCHNVYGAEAFATIATILCGLAIVAALLHGSHKLVGALFLSAAITGAVGFGVWSAGVHYNTSLTPANTLTVTRVMGYGQVLFLIAWCLSALLAFVAFVLHHALVPKALALYTVAVPVTLFITALATPFWTIVALQSNGVVDYGVFQIQQNNGAGTSHWPDTGICGSNSYFSNALCANVRTAQAFTVMATVVCGVAVYFLHANHKLGPVILAIAGLFGIIGFGVWSGGVHYDTDLVPAGSHAINIISGFSQVIDVVAWAACVLIALAAHTAENISSYTVTRESCCSEKCHREEGKGSQSAPAPSPGQGGEPGVQKESTVM